MSAKNDLQEFLQKHKKPFPKYSTSRVGGNDHDPMWRSKVILYDERVFISDKCKSKKQAELDVAGEAFKALKECGFDCEEKSFNFSFEDKKITILVDIENKPKFIQNFVDSVKTSNIKIMGFISDSSILHHKILNSDFIKDERVNIVSVPSTRLDSADVGMIMAVGFLLSKCNTTVYIIISGDHFAGALADCIRDYTVLLDIKPKPSCPKNLETCVCQTLEDVVEKLECLEMHGKFDHL